MLLTIEELKQYLDFIGVTLPDFLLQIYLDQANAIDPCLIGAGYTESDGKLIKLYYLTLLSFSSSDRQVSSESAPSGASRSYRFGDPKVRWNSTLRLLQGLDTSGCAPVPASPFETANAGMWVATGGCDTDCCGYN